MSVTVVTYHYVRDRLPSHYPGLAALTPGELIEQLDHFAHFYRFVSTSACLRAIKGKGGLPNNSLLLTFDDGLKDHFMHVLPILKQRGIPAIFFPCARTISEPCVLDVHKIQFILSRVEDRTALLRTVKRRLGDPSELCQAQVLPWRYDGAEVAELKRLLQYEIPSPLRNQIVDELFREYVTQDEKSFSQELYLSEEELREMLAQGMEVGGHGWDHLRLDHLDDRGKIRELEAARALLARLGVPTDEWAFAYPHGTYDESTKNAARAAGVSLAFTGHLGLSDLADGETLALRRLDTNDFSKACGAPPNDWTLKVIEGAR